MADAINQSDIKYTILLLVGVCIAFGIGLFVHDFLFEDYPYHIKTKEIVLDDAGMIYQTRSETHYGGCDWVHIARSGYILDSEGELYKISAKSRHMFEHGFKNGDTIHITYEEYDPPKGYAIHSNGFVSNIHRGSYIEQAIVLETNKKIIEFTRVA